VVITATLRPEPRGTRKSEVCPADIRKLLLAKAVGLVPNKMEAGALLSTATLTTLVLFLNAADCAEVADIVTGAWSVPGSTGIGRPPVKRPESGYSLIYIIDIKF